MIVKFWGVRGSIPTPGSETAKYGGNTICIEMIFADIQRRIIIDAGSGLRLLGDHLLAEQPSGEAIKTDIFLTHTHLNIRLVTFARNVTFYLRVGSIPSARNHST